MLKALLKKQFMELIRMYFQDNKTGKRRSPKAIIGFVLLMLFVFVSVGFMFFGIASSLADTLYYGGMEWLYFAMMGMSAIAVGVFGSVFTTYSSLYLAKDNELLLSMPIPAKYILFVRMISVYLSSLLYSALAWVPSVVVYASKGYLTSGKAVCCVIIQFLISAVVTVLTCAFGWVIAAVAGRIKNKSIVTAFISIAFLVGYYFIQFKLNNFLQYFAVYGDTMANEIGKAVKLWIYPMYQLGLAGAGSIKSLAIFAAFAIALSALCYMILSASFIKILSTNRGTKKTEYKEKAVKTSSVDSALLKKELKRFVKSPTYLVNGGLGLIILPVIGIIAIVKKDILLTLLEQYYSSGVFFENAMPIFVVTIVIMIVSMNIIAAPSVSLEGKNIWILQSLPIGADRILRIKRRVPVILNGIPALFCTVALCIALETEIISFIAAIIAVVVYLYFNAAFGIFLGVKKANLIWTNETVPIKQSIAVFISMFGGMAISVLIIAGYYFLQGIPAWAYLFGVSIVLLPVILILNRWLKYEGADAFEKL